ncbi:Uncharacterized amino acid permease, GabP family [hydrothermal vent metagenome]|uniref:Uncharacterized amino acid permease, GabP family n=1 Tax=hydrothermal vent metagenome TaxID=652676 RepID=A0A3B0Y5P3_9ZZZZ
MTDNTRTIGLAGAISIGIGGMVGGGIFAVLGEAVSLAHGATAIAFLFAGLVALLSAYSYTKLSVKFQNSGGTVVFIDNAFNHNCLSGSVNLMLWLSYLVTISLYASAFSSYALTFFPDNNIPWLKNMLISLSILLPSLINIISASLVSKSESLIVLVKLILLTLIIISGISYVEIDRISPATWVSPVNIVAAGMIIFVAYEGFELIANAASEIKKPEINLPRAFYSATLLVILLYVLISIVTVGNISEQEIANTSDYALAVAAKPALGQLGFTLVAIAALLSTFSAINATIYGNARLGYFLAKTGVIPELLSKKSGGIPVDGVLVTSILSLAIANSINLTEIAIIGSAGFLLIFSIVNISAYKLRGVINASSSITLLASFISIGALSTLLIHTWGTNRNAIFVFLAFIIFSILFEILYGVFIRKHFLNRLYKYRR